MTHEEFMASSAQNQKDANRCAGMALAIVAALGIGVSLGYWLNDAEPDYEKDEEIEGLWLREVDKNARLEEGLRQASWDYSILKAQEGK